MDELDQSELLKKFPNASKSFLRRNAQNNPSHQASGPEPQPVICHDAVAAPPRKESNPGRVIVRIKSYRQRLLDPDNLIGGTKYFTDGLRYAGLISGDAEEEIRLEVSQEKVKSKADECTTIEIEPDYPTPLLAMDRPQLVKAFWLTCSATWNQEAFNTFIQTLSDDDLRQYLTHGPT